MTTKATALAARTVPAPALVVIPAARPDALRSWRRLVQSIDPAKQGAYALDGQHLDPGVAYTVPDGALVIACDKVPGGFHVRLLRVSEHALDDVKTWELKAPMGKAVLNYTRHRLAEGAARHRAERQEAIPNRYEGHCQLCRRHVAPGAGLVLPRRFRWEPTMVVHHPGQCPPPPEVVRPNRHSEPCLYCGRWVSAGTGIARLRDQPGTDGSRYAACHDGECPADAPIGPLNRVPGWCIECGGLVQPGGGWRDPGKGGWPLRHLDGTCPDPAPYPTWIIKCPRREEPLTPGQVRRVRVDLRGGTGEGWVGLLNWATWRRPDNPPVLPTTPGFRVLRDTYVEMVAVVMETDRDGGRRQRARVRAATPEEASGLLAREMEDEASLPLPLAEGGTPADWSAERIGEVWPWLAEITGRHPDFEYVRAFMPFTPDYSASNKARTRGVWCTWTLVPGRVYQAGYPQSRSEGRREFLRVTPDGDIVTITHTEVESWLNGTAAWIAR